MVRGVFEGDRFFGERIVGEVGASCFDVFVVRFWSVEDVSKCYSALHTMMV